MSVLKSKRKESEFKVIAEAMNIRRELTTYVLRDFAVTGKLEYMEDFLLNDERTAILHYVRQAYSCLEMANSIFINCIEDYNERRSYQNKAIGYYNCVKQELRFVADYMPSKINLNKYVRCIQSIDGEIGLIKQWRRADNKIRKRIEEITG